MTMKTTFNSSTMAYSPTVLSPTISQSPAARVAAETSTLTTAPRR
jgi:hypothetical protein